MCGFAGMLSYGAPFGPEIQSLLTRMGRQIEHRGPDDTQLLLKGQVGLVFKRLSIIDLGGGYQPFTNEDGTIHMVVNGEIYNHQDMRKLLKQPHRFQGASDCEVLLHLYEEQGIDMLRHVNGMFAMCLYDSRSQQVFLARDRMGIKPLFYVPTAAGMLWGSEMKALWVHPDCPVELDWQAYWESEGFNYDVKVPTWFQGIEQIPGGHYVRVDLKAKRHEVIRYWQMLDFPEDAYADDSRTAAQISEEYAALLQDAVELRLMADVELGAFLSGGIDSVAVTAFASQHLKFHTFSVHSQSTFANGDAEHGFRAAQQLGLPNHQVWYPHHGLPVTPADWKHILWHVELPRTEIEHLYKFLLHRYAKHTRPGLKVMLLGQGSDEFNGGYSVTMAERHAGLRGLAVDWDAFCGSMRSSERDNMVRHGQGAGLYNGAAMHRTEFLHKYASHLKKAQHPMHFYWRRSFHSLQAYNLWHEDRTSMANEIESRVPFLDHRLIEFTLRIPQRYYAELFWDKQVLRKPMERHLPTSLAQRKKVLFYHGQDVRYSNRMMFNLFAQDNFRMLQESLEGSPKTTEVLDRQGMLSAFQNIAEDPEHTKIRTMLPLLNMGLLQAMADSAASQPFPDTDSSPLKVSTEPLLEAIAVSDWDAEVDSIKVRLALSEREITEASVLRYAPDTYLLQSHHQEGVWKIEVGGELEFYLEEEEMGDWILMLREIDGKRNLGELLHATGLTMGQIRKNMEEAMDYNVVVMD